MEEQQRKSLTCNKSFVTVHRGWNRSIINYVYRNAFKDLPSVVLSHVCFGICSLIYLHGTCICEKEKKQKQNRSVVLANSIFCGSRESRQLVLGNWVVFLLFVCLFF